MLTKTKLFFALLIFLNSVGFGKAPQSHINPLVLKLLNEAKNHEISKYSLKQVSDFKGLGFVILSDWKVLCSNADAKRNQKSNQGCQAEIDNAQKW